MITQAYVVENVGGGMVHQDVEVDDPDANELLVQVVACGLCHSDVNLLNRKSHTPLPAILGHESTGIVKAVGPGVRNFQPGDKVILCWCHCGECSHCTRGRQYTCEHWAAYNLAGKRTNGRHTWSRNGKGISNLLSQGGFARHLLIEQSGAIKLPNDANLELMASGLSCGVLTGSGTVFNSFKDAPVGSTIAIFGIGAVGAGAIMAARNGHYSKIIAVDLHQNRLDKALKLGATHAFNGSDPDIVSKIQSLCKGVDYAVEVTGVPGVLSTAYDCLGTGGTVAVVGIHPPGKTIEVDIGRLMLGNKRIMGVPLGGSNPKTFIPFLVELHSQGRLPIEKLSQRFDMHSIAAAVAAMQDGSVIKPVLVWPQV